MSKEIVNNNFCNKALELEQNARLAYLKLGAMLYKIREERLYEAGWGSWVEYCMEFKDLSPSSISKLISIYKKFILELGFNHDFIPMRDVGWTKLYEMVPMVSDMQQAIGLMEKASVLSRQDLRKELIETRTGIEIKDCRHLEAYVIKVCPDCGERERIYN